jgi:hypothetical protein
LRGVGVEDGGDLALQVAFLGGEGLDPQRESVECVAGR